MQPNSGVNLAEVSLRGTWECSAQLQVLSKLEAILAHSLHFTQHWAVAAEWLHCDLAVPQPC